MAEIADTDGDEPVERQGQAQLAFQSVSLGDIESARSRHMWTRSAVHVSEDGECVVTGEWDGTVTARDVRAESLEIRWSVTHPEHAVGIATLENGETAETVVVAGRGETGTIAAYDATTGDQRWRYDTVDDLGEAVKDTIFYLPYVVDIEVAPDGETLYAAARRYERDGETRQWHSTVYAFAADGSIRWTYETDASPIALDLDDGGERLAVGYNRCMGDHDTGLVVHDAETGDLEWTWDPGTDGDRRVGDVSFDGDSIAVSSHGDKRGYLLGPGGAERWHVDLAVETEREGETLYAYPNHAVGTDGTVSFVTGNTYAVDARETEHRHPHEHRLATFDADGDLLWAEGVQGFVHGLATDGETVVTPCAQNFRVRDPDTHAVRWFDLETGPRGVEPFEGIATASALAGDTLAAIEEPVTYHDEDRTRGEYALHVATLE